MKALSSLKQAAPRLPSLQSSRNYSFRNVNVFSSFQIPARVHGDENDLKTGRGMVQSLQRDGAFILEVDDGTSRLSQEALKYVKAFFSQPHHSKTTFVNDSSFSGYAAGGEELTDGIADQSETFTVMPDIPLSDPRVKARWPGHGPCPWPNNDMRQAVKAYMNRIGKEADRVLQLVALGFGMPVESPLVTCTKNGWHHMRMLRYPRCGEEVGSGMKGRGIGAHTDYGMLVFISQDLSSGLLVQKPAKSVHGTAQWVVVPPQLGKITVIPGDMMQHYTDSLIVATPHKVCLSDRPRYSMAYFHEPKFDTEIGVMNGSKTRPIHYGSYVTQKFLQNHPQSQVAQRIHQENRLATFRQEPDL